MSSDRETTLREALERICVDDWGPNGGRIIKGNAEIADREAATFYRGYNAGIEGQFKKTLEIAQKALASTPPASVPLDAMTLPPSPLSAPEPASTKTKGPHPKGCTCLDGGCINPAPAVPPATTALREALKKARLWIQDTMPDRHDAVNDDHATCSVCISNGILTQIDAALTATEDTTHE